MTYESTLLALADTRRRHLFETLAAQPMSVAELARDQPISRPAVSQHLKVLQGAGLVTATAKGTRRIYAVDPAGLAPLRRYIDGFWDDALNAFADHIRTQKSKTEKKEIPCKPLLSNQLPFPVLNK